MPGRFAIIVAGGKGKRMALDLPKQFIEILGKPILAHTIEAFQASDVEKIVIVLPEEYQDLWTKIRDKYFAEFPITSVLGGKTRFQSVRNGLKVIQGDGVVAVHDGARPCIDVRIINNSFELALQRGSAVASVALKDSIRKIDESGMSLAKNRTDYQLVQTPQTFAVEQLKEAYEQPEQDGFTDDASVMEAHGKQINLIEGSYTNIKVTTTEDLKVAEIYLAKKNSA
jgi:2-C-methyl-D-erythritol 4-phosphate cytidylyltransferase